MRMPQNDVVLSFLFSVFICNSIFAQKISDANSKSARVYISAKVDGNHNLPEADWSSNWIWYPKAQEKVDFHFYARKEFTLDHDVSRAVLYISAYSDYKLFINGKYIGRGPNSNYPKFLYYDSYDISGLIHTGSNLIAIHAHNYGVGLHWIPVGPGGLIAQLDLNDGNNSKRIVTDSTWKVKKAEGYGDKPVRMQWSAKFVETFDFRMSDEGWEKNDFDDSRWLNASVIGKHPHYPWEALYSRRIPYFNEVVHEPVSYTKGKYAISGFHAVNFNKIIKTGENKIAYAQTYFYNDREADANLEISSDDAFKFFLNGKLLIHQNYDEEFVTSQTWNRREDYHQFHYGMAPRTERAKGTLRKGWNHVIVAIDQGKGGWGFVMGILGAGNEFYQNLPFSSDTTVKNYEWALAGPFKSTGLKNSLDSIRSDYPEHVSWTGKINPFIYSEVTDYGKLMRCETRVQLGKPVKEKVHDLKASENIIIDLGIVRFGHPVLDVTASGESIIDIGYSNALMPDKRLNFIPQVRYADRLILKKGNNKWENFTKRECRYIYISMRKGEKIRLNNVAINSILYPVKPPSSFECSDTLMNRIWQVSCYTTHLLMQDNWQDCLKREEGAHNTRSFNHQFMAGLNCFGDSRLIRKNILDGIQSQDENGWFSSHGPTDNSADEPTQMLWWFELVKNYYLYTGDTSLIKEIYDRMKGVLRYYSRIENKQMLLDCRNDFLYTINKIIYIDDWNGYYFGASDKTYLGYNLLYYGALNNMAFLAKESGNTEDADIYLKKAGFVRKACNELFWDKSKNNFNDWIKDNERGPGTGTAVATVGLYFNAFDDDKQTKILAYMCDSLGGSKGNFEAYKFTFGFYYYFLETLYRYGKQDMAYQLMKTYYGRWLELGATTMGEHFTLEWMKGKKQLDYEYNTHGYSTSALEHFYSNILGIRPLSKGYEQVLIQPNPGGLTWAKGKAITPRGDIKVNWKINDKKFVMDIEGPTQYRYNVKLPENVTSSVITLNGINLTP